MRVMALLLLGALLVGCQTFGRTNARYVVTATPFNLLGTGHPGFCVAVDSADAQGVWWWEPGRSGCSSRSTGPKVFPADGAKVAKRSGTIDVQFEVHLMTGGPLRVELTLDDDGMRREPSGERVPIERRGDLDVPELCCPPTSRSREPSAP